MSPTHADAVRDSTPELGKLLLDVALELGGTLQIDALLGIVTERVASIVHAERALFALCDERGVVRRAVTHDLPWAGPGHPLPVSSTVLATAIRTREPVVVHDAACDAALADRDSVQSLHLRLVVCIPVVGRRGVLGVLYVDSQQKPLPRVEVKIDRLRAIARVIAMSVENAELFEEQRYRAMLLARSVHDLRGPLTVVLGHAMRVAARDLSERNAVSAIESNAIRMTRLIDSTLELARIECGTVTPSAEPVNLVETLRIHCATVEVVAVRKGLSIHVEALGDPPPVATVREQLDLVMDNLLFNAIKYGAPGTTIDVSLAERPDAGPDDARDRTVGDEACLFRRAAPLRPVPGAGFVEVSVRNQGPPIPAALLPRIFQVFVRGTPARGDQRSTGLGLSIVDQSVRHLGGLVWVESSEAAGTCFRFTLPVAVFG